MQFGNYVFGVGWGCTTDTDELTVPVVQIPRGQGGAWLPGQRKPRKWRVKGGFTTGQLGNVPTGQVVRDQIDALKAAVMSGPQNFLLESDRYWRNVQCETAPTDWQDYYAFFGELDLGFVGPDPYAYSTTTTTTADLHTALTYTLALGNAFALPAWYFYANAALNTAFNWTWTNTTTGEAASLSGSWPVSGAGYLIVDALNHRVWSAPSLGGTAGPADAGAQTNAFGLFEQEMPRLTPGVNNFSLAQTGAVCSGVWGQFQARYL